MERIYTNVEDELTTIVDALSQVEEEEVTVVLPRGAHVAQSPVNLRLLRREAEKIGLRLFLASADPLVRAVAERADIPLQVNEDSRSGASSVAASSASVFSARPVTSVAATPSVEEQDEVVTTSEEDTKAASAVQALRTRRFVRRTPRWVRWVLSLFLGFGGLALLAVAIWVLPSATITIVPQQEPFETEFDVVLASGVDALRPDEGVIPARRLDLSYETPSQTFSSTGRTTKEGSRATGQLRITNAFSTSVQPLVEQTRFLSNDGVLFRLQESVVVPGMGIDPSGELVPASIIVTVEADAVGAEGNVAQGELFTIPGLSEVVRAGITGEAVETFSGGVSAGSGERVVSQEDREKAIRVLESSALEQARTQLEQQVEEGEVIRDEFLNLRVQEVRSVGSVGSVQETFDLSLVVTASAFVYQESVFLEGVLSQLLPRLPEDRQLIQDPLMGMIFSSSRAAQGDRLEVEVTVQRPVIPRIAQEDLIDVARGKFPDEAQRAIEQIYPIESVSVDVGPFWVRRVPDVAGRVQVVLDTESTR